MKHSHFKSLSINDKLSELAKKTNMNRAEIYLLAASQRLTIEQKISIIKERMKK